ncbi:MAG: hypothetical protein AAF550_03445 [Myxococcota bacterium]
MTWTSLRSNTERDDRSAVDPGFWCCIGSLVVMLWVSGCANSSGSSIENETLSDAGNSADAASGQDAGDAASGQDAGDAAVDSGQVSEQCDPTPDGALPNLSCRSGCQEVLGAVYTPGTNCVNFFQDRAIGCSDSQVKSDDTALLCAPGEQSAVAAPLDYVPNLEAEGYVVFTFEDFSDPGLDVPCAVWFFQLACD